MVEDSEKLTFWEHIDVLRKYIIIGGSFFVFCAIIIFSFRDDILVRYFLKPLHGQQLIFLSPQGPFLFEMQVACIGAFILSFPVWLLLLSKFVGTALSRRKRVFFFLFVIVGTLLGFLSLLITWKYLVPVSLTALSHFVVPGTSLMLSAESYASFFLLSSMVAFCVLELPIVIISLSYLRILNPHILLKRRCMLYIALVILFAVLTPTTDVFTLVLVSLPAILLTELGLNIAKRTYII